MCFVIMTNNIDSLSIVRGFYVYKQYVAETKQNRLEMIFKYLHSRDIWKFYCSRLKAHAVLREFSKIAYRVSH